MQAWHRYPRLTCIRHRAKAGGTQQQPDRTNPSPLPVLVCLLHPQIPIALASLVLRLQTSQPLRTLDYKLGQEVPGRAPLGPSSMSSM